MTAGTHLFWITSRAAGTAAVIGSSASVAIGILMARRVTGQGRLGDLRAVHEALSLVALALIGLHGVALLADSFFHPGLTGITVPFAGLFWALGVVHSIGAGSDAGQLWFMLVVGLPAAVALFLVLSRLTRGLGKALELPRPESPVRRGAAS
jgi:sulfoxide reductase heme-binding subunit YedZ